MKLQILLFTLNSQPIHSKCTGKEKGTIRNLFPQRQKQTFLASAWPLSIAESSLLSSTEHHTCEIGGRYHSYVKSEEMLNTLPKVRNAAQAGSRHSARRDPFTVPQICHCFPIIWLEIGAILILALIQKQICEEISLTGRKTKRGESRTNPNTLIFFLLLVYIFKKDP